MFSYLQPNLASTYAITAGPCGIPYRRRGCPIADLRIEGSSSSSGSSRVSLSLPVKLTEPHLSPGEKISLSYCLTTICNLLENVFDLCMIALNKLVPFVILKIPRLHCEATFTPADSKLLLSRVGVHEHDEVKLDWTDPNAREQCP